MLVFKVLPGIGDISWIYSKIVDLAEKRQIAIYICNNYPHRSAPFVNLLPNVINLGYGDFDAGNHFGTPLPMETDLASLDAGTYTVTVNPYLEQGVRIENIFPHQGTEYHYTLLIPEPDISSAERLISHSDAYPKIAFYASSYDHSAERGFWNYDEWAVFLSQVRDRYPTAVFYAIGAPYDKKTIDVMESLKATGINVISAIGAEIGATIEVIRRCDYFFAFPSGLAILADVVDTPCTMWYFRNCADAFVNSYAAPKNVSSKKHVNFLYHSVEEGLHEFDKYRHLWLR